MIKANELRIGNWVKRGESMQQVLPMHFVYLYGEEDTEYSNEYEPIPLTPEILEKCNGFEKDSFGYYGIYIRMFDDHNRRLYFAGDYLYIEEKDTRQRDIITVWNKDLMEQFYLHQLQNLYYSLTQSELEVNL